jgi:hypothetical protein
MTITIIVIGSGITTIECTSAADVGRRKLSVYPAPLSLTQRACKKVIHGIQLERVAYTRALPIPRHHI